MNSATTGNIKVSVRAEYNHDYSNPARGEYMFQYFITIENNSSAPVKVLSRKWMIFDSDGSYREVEGAGVIGLLPIIEPRGIFEYSSGCNLSTEMGTMEGEYTMNRLNNSAPFKVQIPRFEMIYPSRLN